MKRFGLIMMAAYLLVFAGCGSQEDPGKSKLPQVTQDQVKQKTGAALESVKKYTLQQKEEYQKEISAELDELQKKIDALKSKAQAAASEARAKLNEEIADLQKKAEDLKKKLSGLGTATGNAWEDLKSEVDKGIDELNKSYEKVRSNY
jgi:archaellum component FlaC